MISVIIFLFQNDPEESLPVTPNRTESRASLRIKLRKIEENYAKYLSLGRATRCYQINEQKKEKSKCRSLSASCRRREAFKEVRSQFVNALATLPNRRKTRTELLRSSLVEQNERTSDSMETKVRKCFSRFCAMGIESVYLDG